MIIRGMLVKDGMLTEVSIEDDLDTIHNTLDVQIIDVVTCRIDGYPYDIVCDDEGLFNPDTPISMVVTSKQGSMMIIVGSLFLCKHDGGGDMMSLRDEDINRIKSCWKHRALWVEP